MFACVKIHLHIVCVNTHAALDLSQEATTALKVFKKFLVHLAAHMQSSNLLAIVAKELCAEDVISQAVLSEVRCRCAYAHA